MTTFFTLPEWGNRKWQLLHFIVKREVTACSIHADHAEVPIDRVSCATCRRRAGAWDDEYSLTPYVAPRPAGGSARAKPSARATRRSRPAPIR